MQHTYIDLDQCLCFYPSIIIKCIRPDVPWSKGDTDWTPRNNNNFDFTDVQSKARNFVARMASLKMSKPLARETRVAFRITWTTTILGTGERATKAA